MIIIEREDLIKAMFSDDYKERFKAEYYQLVERRDKLCEILNQFHSGTLDFELACPLILLENQRAYMDAYLVTLEQRAACENVEL